MDQALLVLVVVLFYYTKQAISECKQGFYGEDCISQCTQCLKLSCNPVNGSCILGCKDGYIGQKCDIACSKGFYGTNCSTKCPQNCARVDDIPVCDPTNGICLGGCITGWRADDCSKKEESGSDVILITSVTCLGLILGIASMVLGYLTYQKLTAGKS